MGGDVRVCFFGDSFVAGTGDPEHRGWAGRIAARSYDLVPDLTVYNLGVRRETSADVLRRWQTEALPRLPTDTDGRIVLSFGVNDATMTEQGTRVRPEESVENLAEIIETASARHRVLVVGPPPVADSVHNDRIRALDRAFAQISEASAIPWCSVYDALAASAIWMREVRQGDGSHPGAAGYAELADLVWATGWPAWLSAEG